MNKVLLLLVLGCLFSFTGVARADDGAGGFVVLPGDVLQINVWNEEGMNQEVLVLPDGTISYPLVGTILAKGMSLTSLEMEIKGHLKSTIPYASVSVSIKAPLGHKVSVIGQVNKPGDVILTSPTGVLQAISQAGGLTPYADDDKIVIIRTSPDGKKEIIKFPYDDVVKGRKLDRDINLVPGDVVVVSVDGIF